MISPERFYLHLTKQGVDFFTGVPDSLMKSLLFYFQKNIDPSHHIITANEGLAIALASGHYIGSGKIPLVYMQNSGLGNAINPLTSLADKEVYSIPIILLIGWRGMPGKKDEPQHKKMGAITQELLKVLSIPFFVLTREEEKSFQEIDKAIQTALLQQQPVALLVPDEIFDTYSALPISSAYTLSREGVLKTILDHITGTEIIVCTTGKTGREWYTLSEQLPHHSKKTFLSVGAMGLANHVALGINLHQADKMIMLDGDGAVLMQMGALATIAQYASDSFIHIIINNGCHESVGGQPTMGFSINFTAVAKACGYEKALCIKTEEELKNWLQQGFHQKGRQLIEIRVNTVSHMNAGRPTGSPIDWKEALMKQLK